LLYVFFKVFFICFFGIFCFFVTLWMHIVFEDRLCFAWHWYILSGWWVRFFSDWCVISDWTGVCFLVAVRAKHDMHTNELEIWSKTLLQGVYINFLYEWISFSGFLFSKSTSFLSRSNCINYEKYILSLFCLEIRCRCGWKKGVWKIWKNIFLLNVLIVYFLFMKLMLLQIKKFFKIFNVLYMKIFVRSNFETLLISWKNHFRTLKYNLMFFFKNVWLWNSYWN
jgi:hypothetical protein